MAGVVGTDHDGSDNPFEQKVGPCAAEDDDE